MICWRVPAAGALLLACSEQTPETLDDPYSGEPPFPNVRPAFALPEGDFGVTSNNGSDSVTALDLEENAALGTAPVGRDPVDTDGPHHIALSAELGLAFTVLSYPAPATAPGPHAAHGSSQRAGYVQLLSLADFAPLGEVRVESNPGDIVLSQDASRLVVSHFDLARALQQTTLEKQRADLAILDPLAILPTGSAPARLIRTCIAPHGVALSRPSGDIAYVACYGEDAIAVVDLSAEASVPELVSVGPGGAPGAPAYGPYAIVLSPSGARAAVSDTESKDVRFFAAPAKAFEELVIPTPGDPYFSAWSKDGAVLYIPTQGPDTLLMVDAETGARLKTRSFEADECQRPHEAVFGTEDRALYLVCEGDHVTPSVVLALDPRTLATQASLPVGVYPDRLAIGRGGG